MGHVQPACARMWRQVLVLFAALSTCDPGNVLDAVKAAKGARLRVSIVGVAAEVHICRVFTKARQHLLWCMAGPGQRYATLV